MILAKKVTQPDEKSSVFFRRDEERIGNSQVSIEIQYSDFNSANQSVELFTNIYFLHYFYNKRFNISSLKVRKETREI